MTQRKSTPDGQGSQPQISTSNKKSTTRSQQQEVSNKKSATRSQQQEVSNKKSIQFYISPSPAQGIQKIFPTYMPILCISSQFENTIGQLSVMAVKIDAIVLVVRGTLRASMRRLGVKNGRCHILVNHAK